MDPTDIEGLLAAAIAPPAPLRPNGRRGPWQLPMRSGDVPSVGLALEGNWASLHLNTKHLRPPAALDLLLTQAAWPGGVKHVDGPALRADVPLLVQTAAGRDWVVRQLRASLAGMRVAARQAGSPAASPRESAVPADPELIVLACAAGGWHAEAKPDGTVCIDLQIRGAHRAVLLRAADAAIRVSVDLAAGAVARAIEPCRAAAGAFLLRASAALRWARAFASHENGQLDRTGFECCVAAPHDQQALLLAVDAVIAGCELFGREAEVLLEHPDIAVRYSAREPDVDREAEIDSSSIGGAALLAAPLPHAAHAAPA